MGQIINENFKGIGDKPNVNKVDKKAFILAEKAIQN